MTLDVVHAVAAATKVRRPLVLGRGGGLRAVRFIAFVVEGVVGVTTVTMVRPDS